MRKLENTKLAIVGLGYVGLPLAVEFGKRYDTVGFDINKARVDELAAGFVEVIVGSALRDPFSRRGRIGRRDQHFGVSVEIQKQDKARGEEEVGFHLRLN